MSAFRATLDAAARIPPRVVVLVPGEWADTWPDKPSTPVPVGLRLISEAEAARCRAEAARKAWELHAGDEDTEGREEAYNGAVMTLALARATCQAEDVAEGYFALPDDQVERAWTPETVERLFGELEALHIRESPAGAELGAEGAATLGRALVDGTAWAEMEGVRARHVRRLLAVAVELLGVGGGGVERVA